MLLASAASLVHGALLTLGDLAHDAWVGSQVSLWHVVNVVGRRHELAAIVGAINIIARLAFKHDIKNGLIQISLASKELAAIFFNRSAVIIQTLQKHFFAFELSQDYR